MQTLSHSSGGQITSSSLNQTSTIESTNLVGSGTTTAAKKVKVKLTTSGSVVLSTSTITSGFTVLSCASVTQIDGCSAGNSSSKDCLCMKTSSNLTYLSDYANTSSQAYITFVANYKAQVGRFLSFTFI